MTHRRATPCGLMRDRIRWPGRAPVRVALIQGMGGMALGTGALVGCTAAPPGGSGAASSGASSGATSSASPMPSQTPSGSPSGAPSDPLGVPPGAQSLMAQEALVAQDCTADAAGAWTFVGTLRNDTPERRTYTVAIAVTTGPSVAGHALQNLTLDPGTSGEVRADKFATVAGQGSSMAPRCDAVVSQEVAK